jgi:hypothetical protein
VARLWTHRVAHVAEVTQAYQVTLRELAQEALKEDPMLRCVGFGLLVPLDDVKGSGRGPHEVPVKCRIVFEASELNPHAATALAAENMSA